MAERIPSASIGPHCKEQDLIKDVVLFETQMSRSYIPTPPNGPSANMQMWPDVTRGEEGYYGQIPYPLGLIGLNKAKQNSSL